MATETETQLGVVTYLREAGTITDQEADRLSAAIWSARPDAQAFGDGPLSWTQEADGSWMALAGRHRGDGTGAMAWRVTLSSSSGRYMVVQSDRQLITDGQARLEWLDLAHAETWCQTREDEMARKRRDNDIAPSSVTISREEAKDDLKVRGVLDAAAEDRARRETPKPIGPGGPPRDPAKRHHGTLVADPAGVLVAACRTVYGERRTTYGLPGHEACIVSSLWSSYLVRTGLIPPNAHLSRRDVAMLMILLTVAREGHHHQFDNLVDIAGYAEFAWQCDDCDVDDRGDLDTTAGQRIAELEAELEAMREKAKSSHEQNQNPMV